MINPDKIMWDKLGFNPEKYEYVKLPTCVAKILKRKKGEHVLLSYILHIDGRDVMMLNYVTFDGMVAVNKAGYACSLDTVPKGTKKKDIWVRLAEDIAMSWPFYAVKKRKKNGRSEN